MLRWYSNSMLRHEWKMLVDNKVGGDCGKCWWHLLISLMEGLTLIFISLWNWFYLLAAIPYRCLIRAYDHCVRHHWIHWSYCLCAPLALCGIHYQLRLKVISLTYRTLIPINRKCRVSGTSFRLSVSQIILIYTFFNLNFFVFFFYAFSIF